MMSIAGWGGQYIWRGRSAGEDARATGGGIGEEAWETGDDG